MSTVTKHIQSQNLFFKTLVQENRKIKIKRKKEKEKEKEKEQTKLL